VAAGAHVLLRAIDQVMWRAPHKQFLEMIRREVKLPREE
jgi:hypothetical protein